MYGFPGFLPPQPLPRLTGLAIITAIVFLFLALVAPQQMPVVLYKTGMVMLGAVLGYWIDRLVFPYARPHTICYATDHLPRHLAMLRRAIVVLACVLGLTLGL